MLQLPLKPHPKHRPYARSDAKPRATCDLAVRWLAKRRAHTVACSLLGLWLGLLPGIASAEPVAYYKTSVTLRLTLEETAENGNTRLIKLTTSQRNVINLARGDAPDSKANRTLILALKIDCMGNLPSNWVIYDPVAATEIKTLSATVDWYADDRTVFKKLSSGTRSTEAQSFVEHELLDSDPSDTASYGIETGLWAVTTRATGLDSNRCPTTVTGSLAGHMNVKFQDDLGGGNTPIVTRQAVIAAGSVFTARKLP